jgi:hypothetical protein
VSTVVVVVDMFVVVVVDQQQHLISHVTGGPVPVIPVTPWVRVRCYAGLAIPNPYPYPCVPVGVSWSDPPGLLSRPFGPCLVMFGSSITA